MPAVFPLRVQQPGSHGIGFINHIETLGDGFEKRINKNLSFGPRADGNGNLTSHKGLHVFTINFQGIDFVSGDATQEANTLWEFYKARLGSFEPFYAYDANEVAMIDLSGANQTGRYLVRFRDDNLTRDTIAANLMKATGILLMETRG